MTARRALFLALATAILIAGCGSARRDEPFARGPSLSDPQMVIGQRVFAHNCDQCHVGGQGGFGPALNNKLLPAWYIKTRVRDGLGAMPSFTAEQINDDQLDAVASYLVALRD